MVSRLSDLKKPRRRAATPGSGVHFTQREDMILVNCSHREACRRLPNRTRGVLSQRAYLLKSGGLARRERDGKPWTHAELNLVRKFYPIMSSKDFQAKHMPGRRVVMIVAKARYLKVKKRYLGATADQISFTDHADLVDQIRMRAREDGISFVRLDKALKTHQYFARNWKRGQKRVNLANVAKAVAFFGGSLLIDWNDR